MHYHKDKLWQIVCFFSCLGQAGILWPEALIWKQKTEQQTWPTPATLGKEQQTSLELAIITPEPEHCLTYKNTQSICFWILVLS